MLNVGQGKVLTILTFCFYSKTPQLIMHLPFKQKGRGLARAVHMHLGTSHKFITGNQLLTHVVCNSFSFCAHY